MKNVISVLIFVRLFQNGTSQLFFFIIIFFVSFTSTSILTLFQPEIQGNLKKN